MMMQGIPWDMILSGTATAVSALIYLKLHREAKGISHAQRILMSNNSEGDCYGSAVGEYAVVEGVAKAKEGLTLIYCGQKNRINAVLYHVGHVSIDEPYYTIVWLRDVSRYPI